MLQLRGDAAPSAGSRRRHHAAASGGVLFLALLVASWLIAIGIGWALWRVLPF